MSNKVELPVFISDHGIRIGLKDGKLPVPENNTALLPTVYDFRIHDEETSGLDWIDLNKIYEICGRNGGDLSDEMNIVSRLDELNECILLAHAMSPMRLSLDCIKDLVVAEGTFVKQIALNVRFINGTLFIRRSNPSEIAYINPDCIDPTTTGITQYHATSIIVRYAHSKEMDIGTWELLGPAFMQIPGMAKALLFAENKFYEYRTTRYIDQNDTPVVQEERAYMIPEERLSQMQAQYQINEEGLVYMNLKKKLPELVYLENDLTPKEIGAIQNVLQDLLKKRKERQPKNTHENVV